MSERTRKIKTVEFLCKEGYFNVNTLDGYSYLVESNTHGYKTLIAKDNKLENLQYFEIEIHSDVDTSIRTGYATLEAELLGPLGYDTNSYCYQTMNGYGIYNGKKEVFGERVYKGQCISVFMTLKRPKRILFGINGKIVEKSFEIDENLFKMGLYPAISIYKQGNCTINLGPYFTFKEKTEKEYLSMLNKNK